MKNKIKFRLKIVLVVSYMVFIYVFSEYKFPPPPIVVGEPGIVDLLFPILHMGEFAILSLLLMYAFYDKNCIEFIISVSILYGIFDETHQYFVPHRYFDIQDICHNMVGVVLGIIGYYVLMYIYYYLKYNRIVKSNNLECKLTSDSKLSEQKHSKDKYPKVICLKCGAPAGNWCKKFTMPLYLALQNGCDYGLNMTEKKETGGEMVKNDL